MTDGPQSSHHRILPPVYFLGALISVWLLDRYIPIASFVPQPFNLIGTAFITGGMAILLWAAGLFHRAGTPIKPFEQCTALVTSGVYRITRNPMYCGMALILLGAAIAFGTLSAFIPVPLFMWQIRRKFILPEEAFLAGIFGEQYLAYKRRVRRWL